MATRTFTVSFSLRNNGYADAALKPVICRISLGGKRVALGSAGCSVDPAKWNPKTGRVNGRKGPDLETNNILDRMETDLRQIFRKLEFSDELSVERIKSEYLGTEMPNDSFKEFSDAYLKKTEAAVGVEIGRPTYWRYKRAVSYFFEFLKLNKRRSDIRMSEIGYGIITDFASYLKGQLKLAHNSAMKMLSQIKAMLKDAVKRGLIKRDPFADYKLTQKPVDRGFLTQAEIEIIANKDLHSGRLDLVRDLFIFACYTGLSYIDMSSLTEGNIVEIDGKKWLMIQRRKTGIRSNVFLLDQPMKLIEKYSGKGKEGRLFPIYSNQKMNIYLKEIAVLCGIEKNLTCHLARHTFATLALTLGVSMESVSKMLGHANLKTTAIYARIINKKIEEDMELMAKKLRT